MSKRSLILMFVGLISLLIMFLQPFKLVVVLGPSMEPTYKNGQILLAKRSSDFKVGDVVVVRLDDGSIIIKRIAFVGDQFVYNRLNTSTQDVELIYGPNIYDQLEKNYHTYKVKIPKNHYYLLGDNWDNSEDSRIFGTVEKVQILYKVIDG